MVRIVLLAMTFVFALSGTAQAGFMTIDYTVAGGGVGVAYGNRLTDLGLTYGMPMSGRISYDPAASGVWAPDTMLGSGQVLQYSPPGSFNLNVGGNTFSSAPGAQLQVEWRNPSSAIPTGLFSIQAPVASPSPINPGSYLRMDFAPWSPVTWDSPAMIPYLDLFVDSSQKMVSLFLSPSDPGDFNPDVFLDGNVTDVTTASGVAATPEPGTLALVATGAALLLTWGRWQSKALHGLCPS